MREFDNIFIENAKEVSLDAQSGCKIGSVFLQTVEKDGDCFISLELPKPVFLDEELQQNAVDACVFAFKTLLKKRKFKKNKVVLVVGVGNEGMTADALGAKTLKYLEVTEQFYNDGLIERGKGRLCCIAGSVAGVTGIRSFDVVKGVVDRIKPHIIVAIDTLSSKKPNRLQRVIQFSDKGITPGSGVNNAKQTLSLQSLGVPVIAVGVPLVIYAKHIIKDYLIENPNETKNLNDKRFDELVVTLKEIDVVVDDFAKIIGRAINIAVHG
jgi:spore protease